MTKKQYDIAVKKLRDIVPHADWIYDEKRKTARKNGSGGSSDDFIEISVETLFEIILKNH